MTPTRLADILDAYGADPARWPAAERKAALALLATEPDLARHQAEAATLDAALARWARSPVATPGPQPALTRALEALPPAPDKRPRWLAPVLGGAVAATIGTALVLQPAAVDPAPPQVIAPATEIAATDAELFRLIFTPTPEEEQLL